MFWLISWFTRRFSHSKRGFLYRCSGLCLRRGWINVFWGSPFGATGSRSPGSNLWKNSVILDIYLCYVGQKILVADCAFSKTVLIYCFEKLDYGHYQEKSFFWVVRDYIYGEAHEINQFETMVLIFFKCKLHFFY